MEPVDGLLAVPSGRVGGDDAAHVLLVDSHMQLVAGLVALPDVDALRQHAAGVAGHKPVSVDIDADAEAGDFLEVHERRLVDLLAVRLADAGGDAVVGEVFGLGGHLQELCGAVALRGDHIDDVRFALRERSGLVEHDFLCAGQLLERAVAADQDTVVEGGAKAVFKAQRAVEHELRGAGEDHEGEGDAHPLMPVVGQDGGHDAEAEAEHDDDDTEGQRELPAKLAFPGLFRGVIVHEVGHLLGGGARIGTGGDDLQFVGRDDHTGVDLVPGEHVLRRLVSGQEHRVEKTAAAGDDAVDGDEFVLTDQDGLTGPDVLRRHGLEAAVPVHVDRVDLKVLERAEQSVRVGRVQRRDEPREHIEEHGRGRRRELADEDAADAGDGHKHVRVQKLQAEQLADAVHDDFISQDEERHHEERDGHETRAFRVGVREVEKQSKAEEHTAGDELEQLEAGAAEAGEDTRADRPDLFGPGLGFREFLVHFLVLFGVRCLDGFRLRVDGRFILQDGRHRSRRDRVRVGRLVLQKRLHFIFRGFCHGVRRFGRDIVNDDLLFLFCQKG